MFKKLQYKMTYLKLKRHVKKALSSKACVRDLISVSSKQRMTGKSVALAKISRDYSIPIIKKATEGTRVLRMYGATQVIGIVPPNIDPLRGRRFDLVLIDEGFTPEELYKDIIQALPFCKMVGYISNGK